MKFCETKPFIRLVQRFKMTGGEDDARFRRRVVARDCRLFFCSCGAGDIILNAKRLNLTKGDLAIIPAGVEYSLSEANEAVEFICVNFDYTFDHSYIKFPVPPLDAADFTPDKIIDPQEPFEEDELNSPLFLQKVQRLEDRLTRLCEAFRKKLIFYENECSAMLQRVLVECVRCSKSGGAYRRSLFDGIFEYIGENYNKPLTNKKIAEIFGYNQNYISDLFKITTGMPLHKYIMNLRMEKAIELLEFTDRSVMEVAEECGFYDIYHFSKAFKAATGVCPTKYEKLSRKA